MTRLAIALSLLTCSLAYADAPKKLRAGQWEFATTREMEGIPPQQPAVSQRCITAEEASDPSLTRKAPEGCEMLDVVTNGNKVKWNVTCHMRGGTQTGTGEVEYAGDRMTTINTITIDDPRIGKRKMTHRTEAHRVGDCAK